MSITNAPRLEVPKYRHLASDQHLPLSQMVYEIVNLLASGRWSVITNFTASYKGNIARSGNERPSGASSSSNKTVDVTFDVSRSYSFHCTAD